MFEKITTGFGLLAYELKENVSTKVLIYWSVHTSKSPVTLYIYIHVWNVACSNRKALWCFKKDNDILYYYSNSRHTKTWRLWVAMYREKRFNCLSILTPRSKHVCFVKTDCFAWCAVQTSTGNFNNALLNYFLTFLLNFLPTAVGPTPMTELIISPKVLK